jgi:hypothetical protein
MESSIIEGRIIHRVRFSPDPENTSFPTAPMVIEARRISDLMEFPPRVKYGYFDDVVQVTVQIPDDVGGVEEKAILTPPFNEESFFVVCTQDDAAKMRNEDGMLGYREEFEVHPTLVGKMWVFSTRWRRREAAAV